MDNGLRKAWRILSPIIIYLVIERLVGFCVNLMYVLERIKQETSWSDELENQIYQELYDMMSENTVLISGIVALLGIFIFYRMVKKEWLKRSYRIEILKTRISPYIFVACTSVGFTLAINLAINAWGIFKYDWDFSQVSRMIYSEPLWMQFVVIGFIVPVCEELLFRGVVYERISQSGSPRSSMILTSILFAFFHGTWLQIIYAFVCSILMISIYQRCGSFRAFLCFHIVSNLSALILRQFPPLSTMGYSVGIVFFLILSIYSFYKIYKGTYYREIRI